MNENPALISVQTFYGKLLQIIIYLLFLNYSTNIFFLLESFLEYIDQNHRSDIIDILTQIDSHKHYAINIKSDIIWLIIYLSFIWKLKLKFRFQCKNHKFKYTPNFSFYFWNSYFSFNKQIIARVMSFQYLDVEIIKPRKFDARTFESWNKLAKSLQSLLV